MNAPSFVNGAHFISVSLMFPICFFIQFLYAIIWNEKNANKTDY